MQFISIKKAVALAQKKNPAFSEPALRRYVRSKGCKIRLQRSSPAPRAHYLLHEGDFIKYTETLKS